jgi:hypothetical protein
LAVSAALEYAPRLLAPECFTAVAAVVVDISLQGLLVVLVVLVVAVMAAAS